MTDNHPTFQELRSGDQYRLIRTGETVRIAGQQFPGMAVSIQLADGQINYTSTRGLAKIEPQPAGAGWSVELDAMDADLVASVLEAMVLDATDDVEGVDDLRSDIARIVAKLNADVAAGNISAKNRNLSQGW